MRLLWSFLALTALTATALAQTTLYETSFENPPFTAGQPAPPNDGWENGSGAGASHVVTDELANSWQSVGDYGNSPQLVVLGSRVIGCVSLRESRNHWARHTLCVQRLINGSNGS